MRRLERGTSEMPVLTGPGTAGSGTVGRGRDTGMVLKEGAG